MWSILTPIHPIGHTNRKGRNNTATAAEGDPAVPTPSGRLRAATMRCIRIGYAGGFPQFVAACKLLEMEVALDFAVQCSPDHTWRKDHPQWFKRRPDGSMRYGRKSAQEI